MATRNTSGSTKSIRNAVVNAKSARLRADERATALSIIYQAERQDKANNMLAGLALVAAALAYLGIAALMLGDVKLPGGSWIPAFLAFPLWVAASFLVLLVWSGMDISKSVEIIEGRLLCSLGLDSEMKSSGGVEVIAQAPSAYEKPMVLKIQSLICYGGVWAVVVAFSVICLTVAIHKGSWVPASVITAGIVYALLLSANVAAWWHIRKSRKKLQLVPHDRSSRSLADCQRSS